MRNPRIEAPPGCTRAKTHFQYSQNDPPTSQGNSMQDYFQKPKNHRDKKIMWRVTQVMKFVTRNMRSLSSQLLHPFHQNHQGRHDRSASVSAEEGTAIEKVLGILSVIPEAILCKISQWWQKWSKNRPYTVKSGSKPLQLPLEDLLWLTRSDQKLQVVQFCFNKYASFKKKKAWSALKTEKASVVHSVVRMDQEQQTPD